jgi:predicted ATPase
VSVRAEFLTGVRVLPERVTDAGVYPFTLPFIPRLDLKFSKPVTFFVGENGTGKSTLIEAIAPLCRLPVSGGSRNEWDAGHGPERENVLSRAMRPTFRVYPPDGYFLRAEFQAHFASLLDERASDPTFNGNPYFLYGGRPLHESSHGEAFLAVLNNRVRTGIYLFDEPEAALSPQRQLALLTIMYDQATAGESQFVIATHSPILLTYPGADIISFDDGKLERVKLEDTSHYQITRSILDNPERYWRYLKSE